MFDMGFAELLIVAVVALIVLGPDKLPTAIKTVGMWVGRIRRTVSSIQTEISEELRIDEMKRTAAISKEELDQELKEMTKPFNEVVSTESPMSAKASSPEELQSAAAEKQADASSDESSNEDRHNPESKS
ncbi:MAG: Sec-independent protein translocase protein TatB [Neptuniibacter sp.]|jgi:sec-independent protein translocase protein TatB